MNSATVDLIYLDPPFNSKANYAAPIGSKAAGAAFKDTWTLTDLDVAWINLIEAKHPALYRVLLAAQTDSDKSYLAYMAVRLIEMQRLLRPTGSIYLHCDPTMGAYLRILMDAVFGRGNFRNEIVWRIGWVSGFKTQKRGWIRNHDTILYYVASAGAAKRFNKEYIPYAADYVRRDGKKPTGKGIPLEDTWNCSEADRLDSVMIQSFVRKTGYPTEKPVDLVRRIVRASSNPYETVLDPFCGCATACIAAQAEKREWVGIDIAPKAAELVKSRMSDELRLFYQGAHRTDIPQRTDVARIADVSRNTVSKLLVDAGKVCAEYQHHALRDLPCGRIEVDEIWSFIYAKEKNVRRAISAPAEAGDVWTWVAICADTKLIPSWRIGDRSSMTAIDFMDDLRSRLAHRVQLTSDGHRAYLEAVEGAFGGDVDFARLIKMYGSTGDDRQADTRYSPSECIGARKEVVEGFPNHDKISTSYIERQNLTMRMSMRRFTRLTNAFSKKLENHAASVALHYMHYNFCRIHQTLKVTPAMEAGVTDRLWEISDIVAMVEEAAPKPNRPATYKKRAKDSN